MYVSTELPIKLGRICRFATPPRVCYAWLTLRVLFSGFGSRKTAGNGDVSRGCGLCSLVVVCVSAETYKVVVAHLACGANIGESTCMCANLPQKEVPNF